MTKRAHNPEDVYKEIQRLLSAANYHNQSKDAAGLTSLSSSCFHNAIVRLPTRVQNTTPYHECTFHIEAFIGLQSNEGTKVFNLRNCSLITILKAKFRPTQCHNMNCENNPQKQLTKHPTKIMFHLFSLYTFSLYNLWFVPFSLAFDYLLIFAPHRDISYSRHFAQQVERFSMTDKNVKILIVNYAPAFWLQATAIIIHTTGQGQISLALYFYTHSMLRNIASCKMQKSSSFHLPTLPKRCPNQTQCLPKDMKLQCRKFFMKEIAKHSRTHCTMFFSQHFVPLFYFTTLGNTLYSLL